MMVPQSPFPSPLTKKLSQLDEEMKSILDNSELGEATKAQLYSTVLSKYLDIKRQIETPKPIPIIDDSTSPPATLPNLNGINVDYIPKQYRNKANNLISHLKNHSDVRWNSRGEMLSDGVAIPGSNMVDLVDEVIRQKTGPTPIGMNEFVKALEDSNVPKALLANKRRVQEVQSPFESPLNTPTLPRRQRHLLQSTPRRPQRGRGLCRGGKGKSRQSKPTKSRQKRMKWVSL